MKHRIFGCTGIQVSEFCLGTMNFGWRIAEPTSHAILDAYLAAGGSFIQSLGPGVQVDGCPGSVGASETIVGRWWRARGISRRDLFLATRLSSSGAANHPRRDRADSLRRVVEASLSRLQTNHLDLLVWECPSSEPIASDLRDELDHLVRHGHVRHVAVAGIPAWQIVDAIHRGSRGNHSRIDALQADYSLLARTGVETEFAGLCARYRLGLLARSPLAGGFLAKREGTSLSLGTSRLRWLTQRYGIDCGSDVVRALNQLAHEHDSTPSQVALAWVLHHPQVTSALIGVNSVALLHELLGAGRLALSGAEFQRLDRVSAVQRTPLPMWPSSARPLSTAFAA